MRPYVFLFVCMVFLNSGCNDSSVQNGDTQYSTVQLQGVVDEYLGDKPNILGAIVKVDVRGEESYEAASGYLDSSRTVPITPNTQFIIGSVTKVFTAVLVMQLVEKGEVQLQGPLISYLSPEWSVILDSVQYGKDITVEQALSHRSGLADVTESEAFWRGLFFEPAKKLTPMDIVILVKQMKETKFKPGTNFDYCNTNYILLGNVVENVSGMSYGESLRENILNKIGLDNTFLVESTFGARNEVIAHGYSRINGRLYDGREMSVGWDLAAGGLVSTTDDLIEFYRSLVSGELFSSEDPYRQMCELVGHNEAYGRGLEVFDDPDIGLHYGHRGSLLNTRALLAYFPERQMTICICITYDDFSMDYPSNLMKSVVQSITGHKPARDTDLHFEGPDILAGTSDLVENDDAPINGDWDFDLKEDWSLSEIGAHSSSLLGGIRIGEDGNVYMIDRGTGEIVVLDAEGQLLESFGGYGDGPKFGYPLSVYVTSDNVHILDMGRTADKIKTYDKNGNYEETYDIEAGVSPRAFVSDDQYVAVRSGPDVLNRPRNELLELISLGQNNGSALGKFTAEDKLLLEIMLPMGRYILLENDIEIFPRMIIHFDDNTLYLGRSDRYLIKRIDLNGEEQLAFSINGRERKALSANYAVDRANATRVGRGKEMPEEAKEEFVAQFPDRQTCFTKITADDKGLIYVFVPDVTDFAEQAIDIFSPDGKYLYRAVFEFPDVLKISGTPGFDGKHLFVLVEKEKGVQELIKYEVKTPEYSIESRRM